MTTGMIQDQNLEKQMEKQMGCMTGFLQIFDRHQMLTGKRLYTTKRLPPATVVDTSPVSVGSPVIKKELDKQPPSRSVASPSPDRYKPPQSPELRSPAPDSTPPVEMLPKSPLPLPIFELNEGTRYSWKFCKETPRLSLDSRATVDAKGSLYPKEIRTNGSILSANRSNNAGDGAAAYSDDKNYRSPSVIARLMGLEPIPNASTPEPTVKQAELRRSASESRVSRDLFQPRFIDGNNNYQLKPQNQSHYIGSNITSNAIRESHGGASNVRPLDPMDYASKNSRSDSPRASTRGLSASPWKSTQQRKSFFDSADFFPEPKQTVSIYGEIEKRLRMRGIDEPSKDLETLKQILEAMQLKGLLHSKKPSTQIGHKNFVYDPNFPSNDQSPIVVMKPFNRRVGGDSPPSSSFRSNAGVRRNLNFAGENVSPRRERPTVDRNVKSPTRARNSSSPTPTEGNMKNTNSPLRRKPLSVETQKRVNESTEQRRVSPIHSPKLTPKRTGSDQTASNRSPRYRKAPTQTSTKEKNTTSTIVIEDETSSSISESTISTLSQTDTERSKMEEYKEGRSLLERCDKLLHSIAEMNGSELHPSPVSVLDSSFYKDESLSPSPVMKRNISFTDESVELEEDLGSPGISSIQSKFEDDDIVDCDFIYISEILRASSYLPNEADVFLLLEKQQYLKGKDASKVSRLQRKLIFDIITEILDRNRQLPPWNALAAKNSCIAKPSPLLQIWSEFQKIRELDTSDDLFEIICGVLKKDLAGDATNGWGDCPVEFSEAILDIERLIFKDLVGDAIRDLAEFAGKNTFSAPRRKLVF